MRRLQKQSGSFLHALERAGCLVKSGARSTQLVHARCVEPGTARMRRRTDRGRATGYKPARFERVGLQGVLLNAIRFQTVLRAQALRRAARQQYAQRSATRCFYVGRRKAMSGVAAMNVFISLDAA